MYGRDNLLYKNTKCSDTLYDHKFMDLTRQKVKGIQKGFASISGNAETDWMQSIMTPQYEEGKLLTRTIRETSGGDTPFTDPLKPPSMPKRKRYILKDWQGNSVMSGVDYRNTSLHFDRGAKFKDHMPREDKKQNFLPLHM